MPPTGTVGLRVALQLMSNPLFWPLLRLGPESSAPKKKREDQRAPLRLALKSATSSLLPTTKGTINLLSPRACSHQNINMKTVHTTMHRIDA